MWMLSKGVKFGVKFNKQGFGAWCLMLCKDKVRVPSR